MTMEEGERMIAAARQYSVWLMYAEELFLTPKYVKVKEMADAGAFGKVHLVKQSEKHFGPTVRGSGTSHNPVKGRSWISVATALRSATCAAQISIRA